MSKSSGKPPRDAASFRHTILVTLTVSDQLNDSEDLDYFLGGSYRFTVVPQIDLGFLAAFSIRLNNVYTLDQLRPNFYLQREESIRGLAYISVDKGQMFNGWVCAYAGVGVGYTWGDYVGTEVDPEDEWTPVVDVGFLLRKTGSEARAEWRIGYQYADRVTSGTHAFYVALGGGF